MAQYCIRSTPGELYHYGVVGMRWGVRGSREVTAFKSTHKGSAKDSSYKTGLHEARSNAVNRLYSRHDKRLNEKVISDSGAKSFAKSLLLGSYGALKYDKARIEAGAGRGKAAVTGMLKSLGNTVTLGIPSKGEYVRNVLDRDYAASKKIKEIGGHVKSAGEMAGKVVVKTAEKAKSAAERYVNDAPSTPTTTPQRGRGVTSFKLPSKEPMFKWTDAERASFEQSYTDKKRNLSEAYRTATAVDERLKIRDRALKLENDYLDVVERDW